MALVDTQWLGRFALTAAKAPVLDPVLAAELNEHTHGVYEVAQVINAFVACAAHLMRHHTPAHNGFYGITIQHVDGTPVPQTELDANPAYVATQALSAHLNGDSYDAAVILAAKAENDRPEFIVDILLAAHGILHQAFAHPARKGHHH